MRMSMTSRATLVATVIALLGALGPRSTASAADQDPWVGCDELCVRHCTDIVDAGAYCQAFGCGDVGICPGDTGNCGWDVDSYDEQVFCNWA